MNQTKQESPKQMGQVQGKKKQYQISEAKTNTTNQVFIEDKIYFKNEQLMREVVIMMNILKIFNQSTVKHPYAIFYGLKLNRKTNSVLFKSYEIDANNFSQRVVKRKEKKGPMVNKIHQQGKEKLLSKEVEQTKKAMRKYMLSKVSLYLDFQKQSRSSLALIKSLLRKPKDLQKLEKNLFREQKISQKFLNQWINVQNKRNKFEIQQIQDRGTLFLVELKILQIICTIGLKLLKILDDIKQQNNFMKKKQDEIVIYDQLSNISQKLTQKLKQFVQKVRLVIKQPKNQIQHLKQSLSLLIELVLATVQQRHKIKSTNRQIYKQEELKPQIILKQVLADIYEHVIGETDIGIYIQNKKDISYHN